MAIAHTVHCTSNWTTGTFEHYLIDAKLRCDSYSGRFVSTDKDTLYAVGYDSWKTYIQFWNKFTFEPLKRINGLEGYDGFSDIKYFDDRIVWYESCGAGGGCAIADKIQGTIIGHFSTILNGTYADPKVIATMDSTYSNDHDLYIRSIVDASTILTIPLQTDEPISTFLEFKDNYVIAGYRSGVIRVWNRLDGSCKKTLEKDSINDSVTGLLYDEKKVIATYKSGDLLIWDLESKSILKRFNSQVCSEDRTRLKIESSLLFIQPYERLEIWNLEKDICISSSRSNHYLVTEKHIILAGSNGEIKFISTEDGSLLKSFDSHEKTEITCLLRKDNIMITGDYKEQIKFWNIHTGEHYNSLSGGRYPYLDGSRLIAYSADNEGCIHIWDFKES